jgi:membrane-associated protease RseP (regulator of RpoE activity)
VPELERAIAEAELSPAAARAAERCVNELRDGLGADAYWRQRTWKRIAVIFAGPGANILVAIALPFIAYMIGAPGDLNTTVKHVEKGTPAQAMALRPGDTIVSVNTQETPSFDAVSRAIKGSHGKPISLTVLRGEKAKMLGPVRPKQVSGRYVLGFEPAWDTTKYGPVGALSHSLGDNWRATRANHHLPAAHRPTAPAQASVPSDGYRRRLTARRLRSAITRCTCSCSLVSLFRWRS